MSTYANGTVLRAGQVWNIGGRDFVISSVGYIRCELWVTFDGEVKTHRVKASQVNWGAAVLNGTGLLPKELL